MEEDSIEELLNNALMAGISSENDTFSKAISDMEKRLKALQKKEQRMEKQFANQIEELEEETKKITPEKSIITRSERNKIEVIEEKQDKKDKNKNKEKLQDSDNSNDELVVEFIDTESDSNERTENKKEKRNKTMEKIDEGNESKNNKPTRSTLKDTSITDYFGTKATKEKNQTIDKSKLGSENDVQRSKRSKSEDILDASSNANKRSKRLKEKNEDDITTLSDSESESGNKSRNLRRESRRTASNTDLENTKLSNLKSKNKEKLNIESPIKDCKNVNRDSSLQPTVKLAKLKPGADFIASEDNDKNVSGKNVKLDKKNKKNGDGDSTKNNENTNTDGAKDDKSCVPGLQGWRIETEIDNEEPDSGNCETYIHSPFNKKFKTEKELRDYHKKHPEKFDGAINIDDICKQINEYMSGSTKRIQYRKSYNTEELEVEDTVTKYDMVISAILVLGERKGSHSKSIQKYINLTYQGLMEVSSIEKILKKAVKDGELVENYGLYKLKDKDGPIQQKSPKRTPRPVSGAKLEAARNQIIKNNKHRPKNNGGDDEMITLGDSEDDSKKLDEDFVVEKSKKLKKKSKSKLHKNSSKETDLEEITDDTANKQSDNKEKEQSKPNGSSGKEEKKEPKHEKQLTVKKWMDVNKTNNQGQTLLHKACMKSEVDKVKSLIAAGAVVMTCDVNCWTPLHEVARNGHLELARLLLEHDANPNIPGGEYENYTPLHVAALANHADIVRLLIDKGADKTIVDATGKTATQHLKSELPSESTKNKDSIENLQKEKDKNAMNDTGKSISRSGEDDKSKYDKDISKENSGILKLKPKGDLIIQDETKVTKKDNKDEETRDTGSTSSKRPNSTKSNKDTSEHKDPSAGLYYNLPPNLNNQTKKTINLRTLSDNIKHMQEKNINSKKSIPGSGETETEILNQIETSAKKVAAPAFVPNKLGKKKNQKPTIRLFKREAKRIRQNKSMKLKILRRMGRQGGVKLASEVEYEDTKVLDTNSNTAVNINMKNGFDSNCEFPLTSENTVNNNVKVENSVIMNIAQEEIIIAPNNVQNLRYDDIAEDENNLSTTETSKVCEEEAPNDNRSIVNAVINDIVKIENFDPSENNSTVHNNTSLKTNLTANKELSEQCKENGTTVKNTNNTLSNHQNENGTTNAISKPPGIQANIPTIKIERQEIIDVHDNNAQNRNNRNNEVNNNNIGTKDSLSGPNPITNTTFSSNMLIPETVLHTGLSSSNQISSGDLVDIWNQANIDQILPTAEFILPSGWKREVITKRGYENRYDVVLYNPVGKKFRSKGELKKYITEKPGREIPDNELNDIMYAFTRVASDFNKVKIIDGPQHENKPPSHLTLSKGEMIIAAIKALGDPKGSNKRAIRSYILENGKGEVKSVAFVHNELKRCVDKKIIREKKGHFKIANAETWQQVSDKIDRIRATENQIRGLTPEPTNDQTFSGEQRIGVDNSISPSPSISNLNGTRIQSEHEHMKQIEMRLQKQEEMQASQLRDNQKQWKLASELSKRIQTLEEESRRKDNDLFENRKVISELQKEQMDMKVKVRVIEESKNSESNRLNKTIEQQQTKLIYLQKVVKDLKKRLKRNGNLPSGGNIVRKVSLLNMGNKELIVSQGQTFIKENNIANNIGKSTNQTDAEKSSNNSYDDRYHNSESNRKTSQNKNENWDILPLGESEESNKSKEPDWNNLPLVESEEASTNSEDSEDSEIESIE